MIRQDVILNMTPGPNKPGVNVSQFDTGARVLVFHLRQDGESFTPPNGCVAIIHGIKPDETYFSYTAEIDGDTVIADCTEQMTAVPGFAECEIKITNTEGRVGSCNFRLLVEKSPETGAIISDTDIPAFEQLATRAEQAAATAISAEQGATESAEAAAESATNAGESADRAAREAETASQAAEEAGESAVSATESASSASGSEASARQYSAAAEGFANDASESAQGAAQAAQTASAKASEAAASADRASGSAVDSATAANLASGYADTARTQAQAAEASATNAAESASTASQAAATATTKAGEASDSATAANTAAGQAASSASAASASAGTASEKATQAGESATNAANSASAAAGSASDASDSAAAALESERAAAQSASDIAASAAQIQTNTDNIADLEDRKANIDGYYEDMTVGDAEQLISSQYVEDSTPYLFRTTGGSADVGNREYLEKIVGGTVAWNQLVENGDFAGGADLRWRTNSGTMTAQDGVLHYTHGSESRPVQIFQYITAPISHILLGVANIRLLTNDSRQMMMRIGNLAATRIYTTAPGEWSVISTIKEANISNPEINIYGRVANEWSEGDALEIKKCVCFDLTAMFGSTIADYIYSLEQSTAGAGVAWFRKLFPEDYYPYDAGTLKSIEGVSAHEMVGFNAYDHATGTAHVVGGMQYQITGAYTAVSLNGETITPESGMFTPAKSGVLTVTGGNDSTTCIHLVHNGSRNGEYEPYVKHSYPLDSSLTLRGIPKLDASNSLYYDGDTYTPDGAVMRKMREVQVRSCLSVGTTSTGKQYARVLLGAQQAIIELPRNNFLSDKYQFRTNAPNDDGKWFRITASDIYIFDSRFTDLATANSILAAETPKFLYELATPTTEQAEPYQQIQVCDDWGTEEFVTMGMVPVGHDTEYPANLRDKLQHLPDLASSDGRYIVRQSGSQMSLEAFPIPIPPTDAGTYTLKATVSSGTPTYTWEVEA